jgi:OmpA-OmpF porin, OOP family
MRSSVAWAAGFSGLILSVVASEARATGGTGGSGAGGSGSSGIALDQLDPAPAGDVFFGVPSPYTRGNLVFRVAAMFDYADQPLRLTLTTPTSTTTGSVVNEQAFLHVNASFSIQDRALITLLLPFAVVQEGDHVKLKGAEIPAPSGAQLGDIRLGLRVRMLGDDEDPFQLGVGFQLYVPTAPAGTFTGEGTVRAEPQLLTGGRFQLGTTWAWSAFGGVLVRPSANPSMITYGAGLAALFAREAVQAGVEFYASTPIQGGSFALSSTVSIPADQNTNAELLFGVKARLWRNLWVGWGAGPGLTQAIGTPALRFVGSLGWTPGLERPGAAITPTTDTDGDGIPDIYDACPYAFGPKSDDPKHNGCPVVDDDEDGIPNWEDACPEEYGPRTKDPKTNGCPPKPAPPHP